MPRILSDLHLLDVASRITSPASLEPLASGVDELILNGDTCETQVGLSRSRVNALLDDLKRLAPHVTLISGNHDPDIDGPAECELAEGRVWVTHGDILFPDLTPWGRIRPVLRERVQAQRATLGETAWQDLAIRLHAYREVCIDLPHELDRTQRSLGAKLARFSRTFFPPTQVLGMFNAWRTAAPRARELAARHRPKAQIIVNGHIHFPFVSCLSGRPTVINTGSFSRPFGALLVDVTPGIVTVRRIAEKDGRFQPGRVVAEIPLAETR